MAKCSLGHYPTPSSQIGAGTCHSSLIQSNQVQDTYLLFLYPDTARSKDQSQDVFAPPTPIPHMAGLDPDLTCPTCQIGPSGQIQPVDGPGIAHPVCMDKCLGTIGLGKWSINDSQECRTSSQELVKGIQARGRQT